MRKVILAVLMATAAATPGFAQPNDQDNRQQQREERQQAREERQQAHEERQQAQQQTRQANVERNQAAQQQRLTQQSAQQQQQQFNRDARFQQQQVRQQQQANDRNARIEQQNAARDARQAERGTLNQQIQQQMEERRRLTGQRPSNPYVRPAPVVSNTPSPGTQPPPRYGSRPGYTHNWNTNWRNNGHYDWHNYRNHHRSLFHLGYYYDPYGWGYQPLSIGWRLWPNYYSSNYWINDPWMYRLPYAPPGYAWVRYFNDAILVDTWSGQVVDVIPGFFW